MRYALEQIYKRATTLRDWARANGIGSGGEPLLVTKAVAKGVALVVGFLVARYASLEPFATAMTAMLTALATDFVGDFAARTQVVPKWKAVTAAVAARRGELDRALDSLDANVDAGQERLRKARDRFDEDWPPPAEKV